MKKKIVSLNVLFFSLVASMFFSNCYINDSEEFDTYNELTRDQLLTSSSEAFTLVVVPDSQEMVGSDGGGTPTMFINQVKWIKNNISSLKIKFVSQVGDITDDNNSSQWTTVRTAMYQLDNSVPYAIAPGNHDGSGDYSSFNASFPYSKYSSYPWYGGAYNNRNHNSYQLFSASGMDFIIIHLAYAPDSSERAWASGILDRYPNHRAIISTHSFQDSSRMTPEGSAIWSGVVKNHNNVFMVICGHMHYQRYYTYKNNFGRTVHVLLSDYQGDNPQVAKLRYYTFKPAENTVYAYTYSTQKNQYYTDSGSQFKFTHQMRIYSAEDTLLMNQDLFVNEYLESSNKQYRLYLQEDGNIVLRDMQTKAALWSSETNGKGGTHLVFQGDGNLVLYTDAQSAVWASNTVNSGASRLELHDNGYLALYKGENTAVWYVDSTPPQNGKYFLWEGIRVDYLNKGGLTNGGLTKTPAEAGDYEIVSFGASHGSGTGNVNTYFDAAKMKNQGFKPIAVRGLDDRKAEMWIRKNSGQTSIDIPAAARAYNFLVLDGNDIQINLSTITSANVFSSGDSYRVPAPNGSGLKILCYFSDDSVELVNVGNGQLLFQTWGFGDGDGFACVLYSPGIQLPSTVSITNHAAGGKQYVGITANFNKQ